MKRNIIDNPRYPHHIKIVRRIEKDWLDDEAEETPSVGDGTSVDGEDFLIVYEGNGRSYTDTTTTGDAKVDSNKRKASIPVRFDGWPAGAKACCEHQEQQSDVLIPMSGDLLYVTKGDITEEWEVKDFEPDNNRSVVYGEMNRNFNM